MGNTLSKLRPRKHLNLLVFATPLHNLQEEHIMIRFTLLFTKNGNDKVQYAKENNKHAGVFLSNTPVHVVNDGNDVVVSIEGVDHSEAVLAEGHVKLTESIAISRIWRKACGISATLITQTPKSNLAGVNVRIVFRQGEVNEASLHIYEEIQRMSHAAQRGLEVMNTNITQMNALLTTAATLLQPHSPHNQLGNVSNAKIGGITDIIPNSEQYEVKQLRMLVFVMRKASTYVVTVVFTDHQHDDTLQVLGARENTPAVFVEDATTTVSVFNTEEDVTLSLEDIKYPSRTSTDQSKITKRRPVNSIWQEGDGRRVQLTFKSDSVEETGIDCKLKFMQGRDNEKTVPVRLGDDFMGLLSTQDDCGARMESSQSEQQQNHPLCNLKSEPQVTEVRTRAAFINQHQSRPINDLTIINKGCVSAACKDSEEGTNSQALMEVKDHESTNKNDSQMSGDCSDSGSVTSNNRQLLEASNYDSMESNCPSPSGTCQDREPGRTNSNALVAGRDNGSDDRQQPSTSAGRDNGSDDSQQPSTSAVTDHDELSTSEIYSSSAEAAGGTSPTYSNQVTFSPSDTAIRNALDDSAQLVQSILAADRQGPRPLVNVNININTGQQISSQQQHSDLSPCLRVPENLLQCLRMLDVHSSGNDWKMFACNLGLDPYIPQIEALVSRSGKSPTECVIEEWQRRRGSTANVIELQGTLQKMKRKDVEDALKDALDDAAAAPL